MARTNSFCNVYYTLDFETAIHGHHVYQSKWTPELNLKLKCAIDTRGKAAEYDDNAIGVYLWGKKRNSRGACWSPSNGVIKTHKTVSKCRQK